MGEKKGDTKTPRQALYRAYRSTSFDEVVGQEHITDLLREAVKNSTVSHAYLFTGPRGTGKTSVARILAFAANNLPYSADASHLDIIEIDAASNRRIDDIRDLREKVHIAPVSAPYKVYIIDEVHMLTGESFNALLKTLEEPPAHAIFILATTELHKVPATIVSRTQRFHFRPVAKQKVVDHLTSIAKKEAINIDTDALGIIAEHGGGSFRDSISLLDQLASLNQKIDAELVESILGRARTAQVTSLVSALGQHNNDSIAHELEQLQLAGVSPVTLSEQLIAALLVDAGRSREWYDLAVELMNVSNARYSQLMLASLLLKFASKASQKTVASIVKLEKPVPPLEKPVTIAQQPFTAPQEEKLAPKKTVAEPEKPITPAQNGQFDWDKVLTTAKKHNAPLFSVLSRATMSYDGTTVVLAFRYTLHRKKLEQPAYRTQLARLIGDACGVNPEVRIESTETRLAENDVTRGVADIMGGGEVVNA